ncbi:uncharacterized protein LOC121915884 [Sceloporus undulatus]|uniref:uncharacterized protein LOC121915884 n=1 Tax=Sceloporus undulatus TaxID=8520 RepID=UPI001C4AA52A|nr:uncharacterized protein LOC121915884 [Sceloporus undulatus]
MPGFKGLIKAMGKPFRWMFRCVKPQKDEDDCPGHPEVKISYAEEEFPESLASRSRISLTDSESDTCPAEADLGPRSDSLEGIPEMLMAESLPSLMDLGCHDPCPTEAKPNPPPASDGLAQPQVTDAEEASPETLPAESLSSLTDKEDGPYPMEGDPGPKADRVPEPQGRTSDKKRSHLVFDEDAFNSSPTEENVHKICKMFPKFSKEDKWKFADSTALKHLDLILEHFLASQETACDQLMYAVLASPRCNRDKFMNEFIIKVNEYQMEDSEELPLAKVRG